MSLAAGLALSSSFEPLGWWWTAPVAVAVLALAVRTLPPRSSVIVGSTFGFAFMGALLVWLGQSFGIAAWLMVVAVQAGWFAALGLGWCLLWQLPAAPVWLACWWTAIESGRAAMPFGGLPWGRLGFLGVDSPWAGLLPLAGVTGTGFLLVLASTALVAVTSRAWSLGLLSGVTMLVAGPGFAGWTPATTDTIDVASVQPGVPGTGRDLLAHHREVTRRLVEGTTDLATDVSSGTRPPPALVVWPENSTAVDPFGDASTRALLDDAAAALGSPLLMGAIVDGTTDGTVLNQGFVWSAGSGSGPRYTKHHPVPFGEYIPYRGLLESASQRLREVPRDMLAGTGKSAMSLPGLVVANAICFDVAYDDVLAPQLRAGAEIVVVQTSNASFTGTAQVDQQWGITRARAMESGRSVVVASTNGISGMIASNGEVLARSSGRQAELVTATVPLATEVTPAVRWGAWIRRVPPIVAVVALVAALLKSRRRPRLVAPVEPGIRCSR